MQAARSSNTNDVCALCGSIDRDALKVRHASVYKIITPTIMLYGLKIATRDWSILTKKCE